LQRKNPAAAHQIDYKKSFLRNRLGLLLATVRINKWKKSQAADHSPFMAQGAEG
jgi:hypothetical protein